MIQFKGSFLENPGVVFALIALLVFALYGKTIGYGYVLDDDVVIVGNSYVQQGMEGLDDIVSHGFLHGFNGIEFSYRPLPLITYALEQAFFGDNLPAKRVVHLLLYVLGCFLFWVLWRAWFPARQHIFALPAVLLFLTHPVHTEVVANLKSRDELLTLLFFLGTFISLARYVQQPKGKWLVLSNACMFLALLSKEIATSFILVMALSLFVLHKKSLRHTLLLSLPFAGILLLYVLIRISIVGLSADPGEMSVLNNALAATTNWGDRLASSSYLVLLYLAKLVWPLNLSWDYSYPVITAVPWNSIKGLVSILINALLLSWATWKLPQRNVYSWAILSFYLTLAIVLNFFVLIGSNFAERFLFTPSVFFVIAVTLLLQKLSESSRFKEGFRQSALAAVMIALIFSMITIDRNNDWESNETLFLASLKSHPQSTRVQTAAGSNMRQRAEGTPPSPQKAQLYEQAVFHYRKAIEILPSNFDAWYNLGVVYQSTGRIAEAGEAFRQTLEHDSTYTNAYNNLGVLSFNQGDYATAQEWLSKGLAHQPDHAEMLGNMGAVYHNQGRYAIAREYYTRALAIKPNQPNIVKNLGLLPQ